MTGCFIVHIHNDEDINIYTGLSDPFWITAGFVLYFHIIRPVNILFLITGLQGKEKEGCEKKTHKCQPTVFHSCCTSPASSCSSSCSSSSPCSPSSASSSTRSSSSHRTTDNRHWMSREGRSPAVSQGGQLQPVLQMCQRNSDPRDLWQWFVVWREAWPGRVRPQPLLLQLGGGVWRETCGRHTHLNPWLWISVWNISQRRGMLCILHKMCKWSSKRGI